ncbi:transposase-like zinc-binding domain-containing protein [Gallibacterium genomosp. 3]
MKTCPFCQNQTIKKYGIRNKIQRYKYNTCNKTFTYQKN